MQSDFHQLFLTVADHMKAVAEAGYTARMQDAVDRIVRAFEAGGKLLVFGNGGSSSDAMHIAAELVGRFAVERRGLPAVALSANPSVLTAWSNDYSFEDVFARQIEALGRPGDVAWGISTSGMSPNVVRGLSTARACGLVTIALTGPGGGVLAPLADVLLAAPVQHTPRIQEVHLVTYHGICGAVEQRLAPPPSE